MHCPACHQTLSAPDLPCTSCGAPPLVGGRWLLMEPLGEGAGGTTWRARDLRSGGGTTEVAIKELAVSRARSIKAVDLFEREARVLATLSHPGIPAFIEEVSVEGPGVVNLYLVQELIAGAPLKLGVGSEHDTLRIIAEIADILVYLHGRRPPVIHRDIKPSNVMMRPDGSVVLIDFGSVRHAIVDAAAGGSTVAGTFGYMAPEQLRGHATAASDLYSVGALAVALLAGRDAATLVDPIRPESWRAQLAVSAGLGGLISRLLEPDDTKRLRDAALLAAEARHLLAQPSLELTTTAPFDLDADYPLPTIPSLELSTDREIDGVLQKERRALKHTEWLFQFRGHRRWTHPLPPIVLGVFTLVFGAALQSELHVKISYLGLLGIFVGGGALWQGALSLAGARARGLHDFRGDPFPAAILERWRGDEDFEAQGRAMIAIGRAPRDFDRPTLRQLHQAWAVDLRRVPLLEVEALAFYRTRQFSVAANLLENAIAIAAENLGDTHILVQTQRRRYAALMFASPAHADMARNMRLRADEALGRREEARGEGLEAMVQTAIESLRRREPPVLRARNANPKAVRKFRFRAIVDRRLPGASRVKRLVSGSLVAALVSLPLAGVLTGVLSSFGAVEFGTIYALCIALFVGVPAVASLLPREGLVPRPWTVLYPRLDDAWPYGHWARALLYDALPNIFRDPITDRAGTAQAVTRLKKMMDVSRPGDGGNHDRLSALQRVYFDELETLRTWHAEGLFAHVASLERMPVDDPTRRAVFFEILAERAGTEKLPDLEAQALGQAERLRQMIPSDED